MESPKGRLANESSPYLLQHASNPVDWFPWGDEAFAEARQRNVPIILSIGYSACHWCHVMERESFENHMIADIMNGEFVSIKVDREERPDIDSVYMNAVQAMSGQGGWPLTVFLTPGGAPFFGGTYYPPSARGGMPGFPEVLRAVADGYRNRQSDVEKSSQHVLDHLKSQVPVQSDVEIGNEFIDTAFSNLMESFDFDKGGFGNHIKFPQPLILEWMLKFSAVNPKSRSLDMVEKTINAMADGGIYDHVGGGFHRYSTDREWLVPHFEKMLYDNALIPRVYLQAYLKTKNANYLNVALDTVEFVITQLTSEEGLFYSSIDADSEGEEGTYYTWSPEELISILGEEQGNTISAQTGMTQRGNFEGKNIIHNPQPGNKSPFLGTLVKKVRYEYPEARVKLLHYRNERPSPEKDDKCIVAWNSLMSATLVDCYLVTGVERYLDKAIQNIKTILNIKNELGSLFRSYKGGKCSGQGFLEDYGTLITACIKIHQATLDLEWIRLACCIAEEMNELFWDPEENRFYDSQGKDELLLVRPRDIYDGVMPSPASGALEALNILSILTDNQTYKDMVICELRGNCELATQNPVSFGKWLSLMTDLVTGTLEIAIVSNNKGEALEFVNIIFEEYISNFVLIGNCKYKESEHRANGWDLSPLLNDRLLDQGSISGFLCQDYTCELPVYSKVDFRRLLELTNKKLKIDSGKSTDLRRKLND